MNIAVLCGINKIKIKYDNFSLIEFQLLIFYVDLVRFKNININNREYACGKARQCLM